MKSLQNFLFELSELDVRLWVDGDRLRCNAPEAALTPAVCAELAERKAEILKFLNQANRAACSTLEPIQPVPRDGNIPLSFGQQGLWFLDQLERESIAYNQLFAIHLKGSLNVAVLEQALTEIIRRHEILRTSFNTSDGQPVQVIAPNLNFRLSVVDLLGLPEANQLAEFQQLAISELERPFHLAQLPLLRVTLLQLKEAEHVLLFTIHHIIADGWSGGIIIRELGALYKALLTGEPCPLPELSIQYADFAHWQQQWLREVAFAEQLTYWKQQLAGAPPVLQLPSDRPRPAIQTFRGATTTLKVEADVAQRLKQLSQQEGATLFMTLLASFQVLLYRYTNQDDICIGTTLANRRSRELELLIGFFVNTVVLRTNLSGNPSFQEVLGRVRRVALEAYKHGDFPFNLLVEQLQPERNLSNTPLFQVMFVLENAPTDTLELPGLTLSPLEIPIKTAKFDLTLSMRETEQGLFGTFEYNTDLFDADTITRMVGHFQTLLSAIVANPQQCLCELPLLTEVEQYQLLREWNDTQAEYPLDQCIHQLFEAQVEQTPDAVAVVFEDEQLTYRQLNQRVNQLAHYLRTLGVKPEVLVGICLERSLEMVVGLLGILKAGGAYVPLDPAYPQKRLAFMVSDAQVSVLLTNEKLVKKLPDLTANPNQSVVHLDTKADVINQQSNSNPVHEVTPDNLAYVLYTSGSTGTPKGVLGCHRGAVNRLNWNPYPFTQEDICCQKTSLNFVDSVWEIFAPLLHGRPTVIISDESLKDPHQLVQTLCTRQVTRIVLVPSLLRVLLDTFPDLQSRLPKLKYWVSSGEALSVELCDRFRERMSQSILINLYGSSEVAADVTWYDTTNRQFPQCVSIGRPISNMQVYVLDNYLQPVPIGVPGELYVSGEGLARGYLNRPELTAEKFIPNPFKIQNSKYPSGRTKPYKIKNSYSERLFKTGDLACYLPDGNIKFLGRIDHQVKIRGFRIELGEIEAVLSQYPEVQEAVVIVREDRPGDKRLVAYIVSNQEQAPNTSKLRNSLKEQLPDYMVPLVLVVLEALPLTPNGKVDRQALPVPEQRHSEPETAFVTPQTPIEKELADIWSEVLNIEQVGIYDNFFDIGGHSLIATQLMSRVQTRLDVEIPLRELFASPTIKELAETLELALIAQSSSMKIDEMLDLIEGIDEEEAQKIFALNEQQYQGLN
jgi:amino acid adenylation domain-containing protein